MILEQKILYISRCYIYENYEGIFLTVSYAKVKVGDEITPLEKNRITREQIIEYGYASGDENPIHMSDSAAWNTGLNGVIVHGLLFIAFMNQALTDWTNADAIKEIDYKMIGSVRAGDNVVSSARITKKNDTDNTIDLDLFQHAYTPLIHAKVVLTDPELNENALEKALCTAKIDIKYSYELEENKITDIQNAGEVEAEVIRKTLFLSIEEGAIKQWVAKGEEVSVDILNKDEDTVEYILYRKRQSLVGTAKLQL